MNILGTARIPAFSSDKVATVLPLNTVLTTVAVGITHIAAVIGPKGVVVAVVGASLGVCDCALCKLDKIGVVTGGREDARDGGEGKEKGREGNHFACFQD